MVFGNLGPDSGSGVLFSRNPATGVDEPLGEWLPGGQGEDVVSGEFDCLPLEALRTAQPGVYAELMGASDELERLGGDVQDIEFTVERGTLWLLQTRVAKRSAQAAVRLALAFRAAGLIDDAEVLRRITPEHVRTLLSPSLQPETRLAAVVLAAGLPASPGVTSGTAYTDLDAALDAADAGEDVILVRTATSPDDVAGMLAARAIVTEIGGATSHAAVVSREIGTPAVVGCGAGVAAALDGRVVTVDGRGQGLRRRTGADGMVGAGQPRSRRGGRDRGPRGGGAGSDRRRLRHSPDRDADRATTHRRRRSPRSERLSDG